MFCVKCLRHLTRQQLQELDDRVASPTTPIRALRNVTMRPAVTIRGGNALCAQHTAP